MSETVSLAYKVFLINVAKYNQPDGSPCTTPYLFIEFDVCHEGPPRGLVPPHDPDVVVIVAAASAIRRSFPTAAWSVPK